MTPAHDYRCCGGAGNRVSVYLTMGAGGKGREKTQTGAGGGGGEH